MVAKATWKWSLQRDVAYRIPGFPRSVGLFAKMVSSSFQWFLLGAGKFLFPQITDRLLNPEIEILFSLSSKRMQVDIVFFQSWMQKTKIFSQL